MKMKGHVFQPEPFPDPTQQFENLPGTGRADGIAQDNFIGPQSHKPIDDFHQQGLVRRAFIRATENHGNQAPDMHAVVGGNPGRGRNVR